MARIDELLTIHAKFIQALTEVDGLEVAVVPLSPSADADLAKLAKSIEVDLPSDLCAFWKAGVSNVTVFDGSGVVVAHEFVGARGALSAAEIARSIESDVPSQDPERRWRMHGIPFHADESYCFVDAGPRGGQVVRQMVSDGEPLKSPIAGSFTEYFELWLAAGCFSYGDADPDVFAAYWDRVKTLIPLQIAPLKNGWLRHLGRVYDNPKFPGG